jgi:hypothetical protein
MIENVAEYKLLEGTPTEMNKLVNDHLHDGWILNGEPFLRKTVHGYEVIVQNIVKFKPRGHRSFYG